MGLGVVNGSYSAYPALPGNKPIFLPVDGIQEEIPAEDGNSNLVIPSPNFSAGKQMLFPAPSLGLSFVF